MKKILLVFVILQLTYGLYAAGSKIINLNSTGKDFKVLSNTGEKFTFRASFSSLKFEEKVTKNGIFTLISADNCINDGKDGHPALPALKKLMEIPAGSQVRVNILEYEEETIFLDDIGFISHLWPHQPSVRKDQDPETLPFYYDADIYNFPGYLSSLPVEVQFAGILRGTQVGRLVIRPVSYNPSQNSIKVIKNIEAEIVFENADVPGNKEIQAKYYSPYFEKTKSLLVNHNPNFEKDLITTYPVKYLIISDKLFEPSLQPFIQWKTRKGFKVVVAYTDIIGNTTTAIKNYIANQYNNGTPQDPAPTFVLLVGDVQQIPAFSSTSSSPHPTDLYYAEMDGGGDAIPDIYYGRFSAQNVNQLTPQINKTLQYEQCLMPSLNFLQYAVMVAGVDGSMAPTYGNGQINYGVDTYFNPSNGITSHTYLYGSGSPITSDNPAAAAAIRQNVSDGVGIANYTAHCGSSGWSDPSFSTSNIPALTNQDKYCFMIGNCCQSSKFDDSECFAEAILRANNKGAIGYIGASDYSYWDEDYYFSVGAKTVVVNPTYDATKLGFYDRMFHTMGNPESEWFVTGAQIFYAGNLAVTQSGSSVTYYWEEYHLMGDPALMPYLGIPTQLTATYLNSVPLGVTTVSVTTEPYAYVGLSLNNTWVDAKYTGSTGSVILDLSTILTPCTLDVVITKQNRQPHTGTITIVPNNEPYVVYNSHEIHDSGIEVNGNVEYSENVTVDVTLNNVGNVDAQNVSAVLTTGAPDVTITDSSQNFGDITASSSATQPNAFAFTVANLITDQQNIQFTIEASDNLANQWQTNFNVVLNAPIMQVTTVTVDDLTSGNGNGRIDPGETIILNILNLNTGHAISPLPSATLNLVSGDASVPVNQQALSQIAAQGNTTAAYTVNVSPSAQNGSVLSFIYDVDAGGYTANKAFTLTVGLIVEDFETNTFTQFPWNTTTYGNAPWIIINSGSIYEGNYSARSGVIGNNATSQLVMSISVISADTISFYKKVSSEQDYDFLKFQVDGVVKGQWSGEVAWSRNAYYLTAGSHTLKWIYEKDYSVAEGLDAAWVDFIIFPPINLPLAIQQNQTPENYFTVYPNPAGNYATAEFTLDDKSTISLSLINALGQTVTVFALNTPMNKGLHRIVMNTGELSEGIYFCKLNTNNNSESYRNQIIKILVTK